MNSNAVLRLMVDALIDTGAWSSAEQGREYVQAKLAEYERGGRLANDAPCPFAGAGPRAALDGLAGAFLQVSEHFELLAEPPIAPMASTPGPDRPAAAQRAWPADGSCRG